VRQPILLHKLNKKKLRGQKGRVVWPDFSLLVFLLSAFNSCSLLITFHGKLLALFFKEKKK